MRTDYKRYNALENDYEIVEIETFQSDEGLKAIQYINDNLIGCNLLNVISEIEFHTEIRKHLDKVILLETSTEIK